MARGVGGKGKDQDGEEGKQEREFHISGYGSGEYGDGEGKKNGLEIFVT